MQWMRMWTVKKMITWILNKGLARFEHSSLPCFNANKCFNLIKCQKGCWFSVHSAQYLLVALVKLLSGLGPIPDPILNRNVN